jgi:hypothetical protein
MKDNVGLIEFLACFCVIYSATLLIESKLIKCLCHSNNHQYIQNPSWRTIYKMAATPIMPTTRPEMLPAATESAAPVNWAGLEEVGDAADEARLVPEATGAAADEARLDAAEAAEDARLEAEAAREEALLEAEAATDEARLEAEARTEETAADAEDARDASTEDTMGPTDGTAVGVGTLKSMLDLCCWC